jgi:hypothetical protein
LDGTQQSNLIQLWLAQFDRGEPSSDVAEASVIVDYEAKIAALERKVGQLTMELELAKKRHAFTLWTTTRAH